MAVQRRINIRLKKSSGGFNKDTVYSFPCSSATISDNECLQEVIDRLSDIVERSKIGYQTTECPVPTVTLVDSYCGYVGLGPIFNTIPTTSTITPSTNTTTGSTNTTSTTTLSQCEGTIVAMIPVDVNLYVAYASTNSWAVVTYEVWNATETIRYKNQTAPIQLNSNGSFAVDVGSAPVGASLKIKIKSLALNCQFSYTFQHVSLTTIAPTSTVVTTSTPTTFAPCSGTITSISPVNENLYVATTDNTAWSVITYVVWNNNKTVQYFNQSSPIQINGNGSFFVGTGSAPAGATLKLVLFSVSLNCQFEYTFTHNPLTTTIAPTTTIRPTTLPPITTSTTTTLAVCSGGITSINAVSSNLYVFYTSNPSWGVITYQIWNQANTIQYFQSSPIQINGDGSFVVNVSSAPANSSLIIKIFSVSVNCIYNYSFTHTPYTTTTPPTTITTTIPSGTTTETPTCIGSIVNLLPIDATQYVAQLNAGNNWTPISYSITDPTDSITYYQNNYVAVPDNNSFILNLGTTPNNTLIKINIYSYSIGCKYSLLYTHNYVPPTTTTLAPTTIPTTTVAPTTLPPTTAAPTICTGSITGLIPVDSTKYIAQVNSGNNWESVIYSVWNANETINYYTLPAAIGVSPAGTFVLNIGNVPNNTQLRVKIYSPYQNCNYVYLFTHNYTPSTLPTTTTIAPTTTTIPPTTLPVTCTGGVSSLLAVDSTRYIVQLQTPNNWGQITYQVYSNDMTELYFNQSVPVTISPTGTFTMNIGTATPNSNLKLKIYSITLGCNYVYNFIYNIFTTSTTTTTLAPTTPTTTRPTTNTTLPNTISVVRVLCVQEVVTTSPVVTIGGYERVVQTGYYTENGQTKKYITVEREV